jgi:hypothetical protein
MLNLVVRKFTARFQSLPDSYTGCAEPRPKGGSLLLNLEAAVAAEAYILLSCYRRTDELLRVTTATWRTTRTLYNNSL